jgi:esterase
MINSKIEGEGKPFVIIHGFLGMLDNWKTFANQIVGLGYQVHSLDMRNHGKSFHSNVFNYDVMVEDVLEYLQFHQIKNLTLLGHSMGGKVAMLLACLHPEMIKQLFIADIGPKYYPPHHQTILQALQAVDFSVQPTRADVDLIISNYITDFGTKQFLLKNLYWETPNQLKFRFNLASLVANYSEIGKQLPVNLNFSGKTTFLRGEKSDYILDQDYETINYHFTNANVVIIGNAGHWLHAENPSEFYEKVKIEL